MSHRKTPIKSQHTTASTSSVLNTTDTAVIDWLLAGDPAIAWQTQRDVLGAPAAMWLPLQQRTLAESWGARLLALQDPDGGWGGGMYSPKEKVRRSGVQSAPD